MKLMLAQQIFVIISDTKSHDNLRNGLVAGNWPHTDGQSAMVSIKCLIFHFTNSVFYMVYVLQKNSNTPYKTVQQNICPAGRIQFAKL
jgi:hypothetical protein